MAGLVAAVVGAPSAVPAASAASPSSQCLVKIGTTRYTNLATAISAASTNATLNISGTCAGTFTVTRSMTLQRLGPVGVLTPGGGNGQGPGTVLTITDGARVIVKGLSITGGEIGVTDQLSSVTLYLCLIYDNGDNYGGGVSNDAGNLNLVGTYVYGNTASDGSGAGIVNYEGAVTLSQNSGVYENYAGSGGGGIENNRGTVTLNDGSGVGDNEAGGGGGIDNYLGSVTLNGHSSVDDNGAAEGGGILNYFGTVTLTGSSTVAYNESDGIDSFCGTLNGATAGVNVYDNSPENIFSFCI
ncbi:MAG TPA: hypothetical protein VKR79_05665 [Gaiellaceae bacterium]|nr:hypothetical protein [Gaiellaceae bacterium]